MHSNTEPKFINGYTWPQATYLQGLNFGRCILSHYLDEFHVWITSKCNNIHFDEWRKMTQLDEICPSSWTWNNWINIHDVSRCINFIHGIECNIHEISSMDSIGWTLIYKNLWMKIHHILWWNKVHKK
jgi:hypothetical protein